MKYENASGILPAQLIGEIQKYYSGGLLWIPVPPECLSARDRDLRERDELIVKLYEKGETMRKIAKIAQVTEERVRQIIRKAQHPNGA